MLLRGILTSVLATLLKNFCFQHGKKQVFGEAAENRRMYMHPKGLPDFTQTKNPFKSSGCMWNSERQTWVISQNGHYWEGGYISLIKIAVLTGKGILKLAI